MQTITPRERSTKRLFVKDLRPQDTVQSTFIVKSKDLGYSKNAKAFLNLTLSDRTGDLDSRVWEDAENTALLFKEGDVVAVAGRAHQFQNRLQLSVQQLTTVPANEVDLADYLPATDENLEAMFADLLSVFEKMDNLWVRELGLALLKDPEIGPRFKVCPAAKTIHHAFIGGLLCHVTQLVRLCEALVPHYEDLNREELIFGAVFHDFGKVFELSYDKAFGYTDEGKLVGHIPIGATLTDRAIQRIEGFPKALEFRLKHLILSHHGRLDYGSPKVPVTLEALVLHQVDDLDSKMESITKLMRAEKNGARWTSMHRAYQQSYYKPDKYLSSPE